MSVAAVDIQSRFWKIHIILKWIRDKKIYLSLSVCLSASPSVCQHFRLSVILTVCCQCLRLSVSLSVRQSNSSSVFSVSFRCLLSVTSSVCQPVYLSLSSSFIFTISVCPAASPSVASFSACLSAMSLSSSFNWQTLFCLSLCLYVCLSVCLGKQLCLGWRGNHCTR